ncbi:tyrosine-protein phosphatase [Emticicia sp. SJ17W-69]|uniref:tyrosine-protein phosphatase n=1 Tax=Emticicia sp. SJ17W-69 TaxID=3421657 RepID=UPI003EBBBBEE
MLSFLKKAPKETFADLLKVDIHSHLIPGIDDGSPDMETSLHFLGKLSELGYKKVITTPHIMTDFHPNDSKTILSGLTALKSELKAKGINIEVEAAAEYFLDTTFEKLLAEGDILSFGAKKYVLVEMSFIQSTPNFEEIIFNLLTKGYTPILAHPERYTYWQENSRVFRHIQDLGCLMQVNIPSLLGYYGKPVKNLAIQMIKSGYIDFLGTDLHHIRHLDLFIEGKHNSEINALVKKYDFKNHLLL